MIHQRSNNQVPGVVAVAAEQVLKHETNSSAFSTVRPYWVVVAALLFCTISAWAQSTLIGELRIGSGLTGSPIFNPPTVKPPIPIQKIPKDPPIMVLEFLGGRGTFVDTTSAVFMPFGLTIPGIRVMAEGLSNKCDDNEFVSAVTTSGGLFDRSTGTLDDLRMTITVKHMLTTPPNPSFSMLFCPLGLLADDVVTVSLTTKAKGGSPLTQKGNITLVGTGTKSAGDSGIGSPVSVTIAGKLVPPPNRTLPPANCVTVPDVTDGVPANAEKTISTAGLKPILVSRPGIPLSSLYVYRQSPVAETCVAPGTTVYVFLRVKPVQ